MKHWKTVSVILLFLFSGTVSAISSQVKDSCGANEVDLVSINSTEGGHIGKPGYYGNEICVSDVRETKIKQSCAEDQSAIFSMMNETNSHFSAYSGYALDVCGVGLAGTVKESCGNATAVFSIKSRNNSHVGDTDYYDKKLCLERVPPKNITLTLDGVSGDIYADDQTINTGENFTSPVEYPYIVSDQPAGIVSFGEFVQLSYPRSSEVSMTLSSGSFLLPFTQGGYREIEDEQQEVNDRDLLSLFSPNFGFSIPEEPVVRVALDSPHNSTGFRGKTRNLELEVRNKGLQDSYLMLEFLRE